MTTDTVYYVCKYTPLELLDGFGVPSERLDPAPASFECADSCAHPNLCGYGKAVLEEVLEKGIDSLLLVDCCDVCRRIYDVLLDQGRIRSFPLRTAIAPVTRILNSASVVESATARSFFRNVTELPLRML